VNKTLSACLTRRREDAKNLKDSTPQTQTPLLTLRLTSQPFTTSATLHFAASRLRVKNHTLLASREDAKNRKDSTPQTQTPQHTIRLTSQPPSTCGCAAKNNTECPKMKTQKVATNVECRQDPGTLSFAHEWQRSMLAIPFRLAHDFNCRRPLQSPADVDVKSQSLDDY
jgi:hypothetical protein